MPEKEFKKIFVFLDTDKHASAFDIITVMDIFPEAAILKYENVTEEDADRIVHDVMFPRGPEGAKHTKIFIDGYEFERAQRILDKIRKIMFSPFELTVIIDPRGAYTTAAAAVEGTLKLFVAKGAKSLENRKVVVLAGTGPVGQTVAKLFAGENLDVTITSRSLQKASSIAARISEEMRSDRVHGVEAQTSEVLVKIIEDADIILSAGAAGTQVLPLQVLEKTKAKRRVIADINAIPPIGIEGLDSNDDGKEILPHVFGIGALTIGKFKNKIEKEIIRKASEQMSGVLDYKVAYEVAKQIDKQKEKRKTSIEETPKHWLP